MEVFIRGIPRRESENSLNNFFGDVLSRAHIEDWICLKISHKPYANLIFLSLEDGERFLSLYGSTNATFAGDVPGGTSLMFKGQPLSCCRSRETDVFAIRSLEMTKKAREKDNTTPAKAATTSSRDFRTLRCTSVSCGIWEHTQSGVVFQPFFTSAKLANISFRSKMIVFETDVSSQRLEIPSRAIESVVWEGPLTAAITLTLREAPRIIVRPDAMLAPLLGLADLLGSLFADNHMPFQDVPEKNRVPGLDNDHEEIAGSCLVYQFKIAKGSGLEDPARSLALTRGLPSMVQRHILVNRPSVPYAIQLRNLVQHLSEIPAATLSFGVRFQLQKLAQNGYLSPSKVADLLPEVKSMFSRSGNQVCVNVIRRLFQQIPYAGPDIEAKYFSLHHLTALLRQTEFELKRGGLCDDEPISPDQVAAIHKATVTPSGVYLDGPYRECNNRVLRKYARHHDFFLRVQFCDEDGLPVQYNRDISNKPIFGRFKMILTKGFRIADRHFSFLGFSHSSLRSQSCWFMAPFVHNGSLIYYNDLIKDLGDFSGIRTPARCAARIGQAFTDTRDAINFAPGIVKDNNELTDIVRNGRVFSDGVGTLSREALEQIWDRLPSHRMRPTVLQIRYQGAKGVIALDSRLKGKAVFIRPSMTKFRGSTSNDIEICTAAYKANELRLNEQLIKILEDMGVGFPFFLDLQAREIERLRSTTSSTEHAAVFLKSQSIGDKIHLPRFLRKLTQLHLSFQDDNFLTHTVETAVLIQLRALKYKARIPVQHGFTLLGIMDETGILEEGQIFCIVDVDGRARVITGDNGQPVIISRSPALHPGDVQLATAVTVPESSPLRQLRNCICFSQKGQRDLPSKLSGGDLDGDTFHIIFDPNAQTRESFAPADYARLPSRELDRPVNRQDMVDFFVDFMETDQLGHICNTHKMLADQSDRGVNDERCIKLAQMASTAVDFSKTGIPVKMKEMPRYSRFRPHFMAPGPHVEIMEDKPISFDEATPSNQNIGGDEEDSNRYRYYRSHKILGKLFDAIDEREIFQQIRHNSSQHALHGTSRGWDRDTSLLKDVWSHMRDSCPSIKWDRHLDRARGIRDEKVFPFNFTLLPMIAYEYSLLDIMFEYGPRPHLPLSEVEVFVGNMLGKTGALTTRQREQCISMKERFEDVLSFTVELIRGEEHGYEDAESKVDGAALEQVLGFCMACLWAVLNEKPKVWESGKNRTSKLRSFGYVAAAVWLTEREHLSGC